MTTLEAIPVRVPLRAAFATAAGVRAAHDGWILRLADAAGRTGLGEVTVPDAALAPAIARLLAAAAERAAAGDDPAAGLAEAGPAGLAVLAGLAAARLDRDGTPAPALLPGGPGIGVNATLDAGDAAATVAGVEAALAAGFRTVKCKAAPGEPRESLVKRLTAIRSSLGPDVALRLDVNGTWDLAGATLLLSALAPVDLAYVEQPLPPDDLAGMATLRARGLAPIAADEAVASPRAARAVLEAGAADVLVVKPARVGGPAAAAAIAALAAAHGVPVVVSTLLETGLGLAAAAACAAALPDVPGSPAAGRDHGLATAGLLATDLLAVPLAVADGRLRVPGGPGTGGLGVALDPAALAAVRTGGGSPA